MRLQHRRNAASSHPILASSSSSSASTAVGRTIIILNHNRSSCNIRRRKRDWRSRRSISSESYSSMGTLFCWQRLGQQPSQVLMLALLFWTMFSSYSDRNVAVAFSSKRSSCYTSHFPSPWQFSPSSVVVLFRSPTCRRSTRSYSWNSFFQSQQQQQPQHCSSLSAIPRPSTALFMAKGDGKTRKKKKKPEVNSSVAGRTTPSTTSSSSSSSTPPLRVSNHINVPVRQQIAWAKLNKQYSTNTGRFRQSSASSVKRTSYRKTTMDEEEWAEKRATQQRDPDWDVILTTNMTRSHPPLMIVDGYNIIHKWPRLKKHMVKNDPARARQILVEDLENLASIKGWRIECVFDGAQQQQRRVTVATNGATTITTTTTPRSALNSNAKILDSTNKSVSKYGVRVVYTSAGIEADSYIEARCSEARSATGGTTTGSLIVATDDAMIRIAGHSAGALCMGADRFIDELKATKKAIQYRVEAAMAKVNGHAIRPERLRTPEAANAFFTTRFGRHSVIIEDKRNRTKAKQQNNNGIKLDNHNNPHHHDDEWKQSILANLQVPEVDENGIPWWAKIPADYNPHK